MCWVPGRGGKSAVCPAETPAILISSTIRPPVNPEWDHKRSDLLGVPRCWRRCIPHRDPCCRLFPMVNPCVHGFPRPKRGFFATNGDGNRVQDAKDQTPSV